MVHGKYPKTASLFVKIRWAGSQEKNISYPPHPLLLHVVEGVSKSVTTFVFSDHAARIVSVVLIVMERQTVRGKDILMMTRQKQPCFDQNANSKND